MAAKPSISLFDVFMGRGRTIRNPTGPPGLPFLETHWRDPNKPSSRKASAAASAGGSAPGSGKNGSSVNSRSSTKSKAVSAKGGPNAPTGDGPNDGEAPKDDTTNGNTDSDKPADAPKSDSGKGSNGSKKSGKGSDKNSNDSKASNGKKRKKDKKSPAQSFTEEEDVRLIRLVGEDKNWREIAKELHKPQTLLRKRYEEINPFKHKSAANDMEPIEPPASHSHSHSHSHNNSENSGHKHRCKHHTSRHTHTHASHRRTPSIATRTSSVTTTAYTLPSMISLAEDDLFSYGEIAAISELIERDMDMLWCRVSAGFYDMSGRRVAAEDIRGKFMGLGGGG